MPRWEYMTLQVAATGLLGGNVDADALTDRLNALGRDGWELASAFDTSMGHGRTRDVLLILKRASGESARPIGGAV